MHYPQSGARATLDSTVVARDDNTTYASFAAPARSDIDCFYVYPTVDPIANPSPQVGATPPMPTDIEANTTWAQVGRLIGQCRMFVPVYRQLPLPQLTDKAAGLASYELGARDVEQAWNDYWTNDNVDPGTHRRHGVVLLGHSQGSYDLQTLIQHQIDGNAEAQRQLISAVLIGANTVVPRGREFGGGTDPVATFQYLPPCRRTSPTAPAPIGCVVAYSTFNQPAGRLLPRDSHFGRSDLGHEVVCVNPAALRAGLPYGAAAHVAPQIPTGSLSPDRRPRPGGLDYPTGFAAFPGRLTARCTGGQDADGTARWLQVSGDDRFAPVTSGGTGLHPSDWALDQDDVDALIADQIAAWRSRE